MAKNPSKREQSDLKRRLRQRGAAAKTAQVRARVEAAQARLVAELEDPSRLTALLARFTQLALAVPTLAQVRFPPDAFTSAWLEAELGEEGDAVTKRARLRQQVFARLLDLSHVKRALAAIDVALGEADVQEALVALLAARALASSAEKEEPPRPEHAFWSLLYDLTATDALFSGHFLIRLVLGAIRPDAGEVAQAFAKALATDADLGRDLDALGVEERDPQALAEAYLELFERDDSYHLQLDAVLHLVALHVALCENLGRYVTAFGPLPSYRREVLGLFDEAYHNDMQPELAQQLQDWFRSRLEVLRDGALPAGEQAPSPEALAHERRRAQVTYLASRVFPAADDALLRSIYLRSLVRCRTQASELEAPFVDRLWSQPTDTFAIDEYAGLLRERQEQGRAARVRRYAGNLKAMQEDVARRLSEVAGDEAPADPGSVTALEAEATAATDPAPDPAPEPASEPTPDESSEAAAPEPKKPTTLGDFLPPPDLGGGS